MNIKEAAKQFVMAHKPDTLDVDHLSIYYGSVEGLLEAEGQPSFGGDCGERYIEISSHDSITGNPIIVSWYEEAWQIAFYRKSAEDRVSREDHEPEIIFDPDFDEAIRQAVELYADGVFDLSVTRFEDGVAVEIEPIEDYIDTATSLPKFTYNQMLQDARLLARKCGVQIRRAEGEVNGKAAYEFVNAKTKEVISLGSHNVFNASMLYENVLAGNLEGVTA